MKAPQPLAALVGSATMLSASIDIAPLQDALDQWAGGQPGTVVALVVDGDETAWVSAGRWSVDDNRQADADTLFEIGSITKVFTALLAADAVGQGTIAWDDPVGAPFAESTITYAQLATHTSGLRRLPRDFPDTNSSDPYAGIDQAALAKSFAKEFKKAQRKSGEWAYSNFGASVLGEAVGEALGGGYPAELRAHVLTPLGMVGTWLAGCEERRGTAPMAPGHNGAEQVDNWHFIANAPAGALVSSAHEMEKFMRAILAGDMPASWADTMQIQTEAAEDLDMGYGWLIRSMSSGPVYWHNGGTGGYRSFVGVQPETGRGIVVLGANTKATGDIALGWLQGLLDSSTAVSDESMALEDYVGDYLLGPNAIIRMTATDGKLYTQLTRQPRLGLSATGTDTFKIDHVSAKLVFERDDKGEVTGLILYQGGREQRAPRHPAGTLEPERPNLELTAEQVAPLVGEYQLAPGATITITAQGGQLFAQLTGQQRFPVFASSPDVFFYDVVEAELHFERDGDGQATRVVLHQNGAEMPASRLEGEAKPPRERLTMPSAQLAPLVGDYQLMPGIVIRITAEDGQLQAQLSGQQRLPVYAASPDVFFYEAVEAELHFDRDDEGQVTRVVLHQNGQKMPAPRLSVESDK